MANNFPNQLNQEFKLFYKNQEFGDDTIKGIKIYKILLEARTGKRYLDLKRVLVKYPKDEINGFLNWIYSETKSDSKFFNEICKELRIDDFNIIPLKECLKRLYFDQKTKDYGIVVNKQIIKVHKMILQCRSQLFRGMFLSTSDNAPQIKDYTKKSVNSIKIVIRWLYLNEINKKQLTEDIKNDLLDINDFYGLHNDSNWEFELNYQ